MKNINKTKQQQSIEMQEKCIKNNIDFRSMEKLLDAERVKKITKRNNYLQQIIADEIEKQIKQ